MYMIVYIAALVALSTVGAGIYIYCRGKGFFAHKFNRWFKTSVFFFATLIGVFLIFLIPDVVQAATQNNGTGYGFIAAALSTGLATIGAGYAVGAVGSSALGAVSEDPKILGKTLIFVGLAEGIAIYGLIVSIMILGQM
ncbi:V/A-type H+-transporting ATPase subunit K [Caldanaerobius fijiensis DSM 17918]|uniref:V/A-type H+-transporting ATPase subunit K n=1 Tax=Caldanaerobius fijiensis DSM 17918 TaxID=1121256 RepID=A0A1M4W9P9_9THEO|nr:ATP synthase subunit C [Caldanaerobius fijiensis]SHE77991.1 V/A-type H+-transporting ATPase subunit K [Caldanaerobius fijiensis DSM 17918]